ncbi:hypothetical protein NGTWS0302_07540 [Mycolicibacterium cyprinidarum]|uniref:Low molecular weight antigen MTB12-like C-terminal domain-containing protein n=1 Tax=Mycolicibacterium cyprinidarum TaxID=2860311 RepID=A0ABQ4V575_9MYCO|nr:hypothetical protein NGTWS1702_35780 [Mycolicibacterium sp. NGTWSNA01]GJF12728.1 hypothetical protein NGTWS1803_23050 [Mycolicibacterium sp. NGTWS1803]GJF14774.1 hypothetical protein NGTWS0302_07540 [Mycolicibacterium sp. NGTWS0302]
MVAGFRVLVAAVIATAAVVGAAPTASAEPVNDADPQTPGGFAITSEVPTLAELDAQIRLLVGTPAPDAVKAAQLEGGERAVVVPKMVYRIGFFRPPRGSSAVTGPETHDGDTHTAVINASRQGAPTVQITAEWRRIDGRWKLASKSLCNGIATLGLPIPCNFQ